VAVSVSLSSVRSMAIARRFVLAIDCPDPVALARFYGEVLGWSLDRDDGGWVEITSGDGQYLAFQRVEDFRPPVWPGQDVPQQMHLDLPVEDLDVAEAAVLALGATKHEVQPSKGEDGDDWRVFLDPVGHPFCLCSA
jgi:predicted enzyme related to lactoylglutathione lyase